MMAGSISSQNESTVFQLGEISSGELAIFAIMTLFTCATVVGNLLVIAIILCNKRLYQNVTNCFIASLAFADLLLGSVVLPFAIIDQIRLFYRARLSSQTSFPLWPFGQDWCDLWHAFDVLSSTGSILSLCVISVERYIAISDPFNYHRRMKHSRSFVIIAVVWFASILISFPAIFWWRSTAKHRDLDECHFSQDRVYLLISSCISFYIPLFVMICVYWKIYRTANNVQQNLASGRKVIRDGQTGENIVIGVHRGNPRYRLSQFYDKLSSHKGHATGSQWNPSVGNSLPGHDVKESTTGGGGTNSSDESIESSSVNRRTGNGSSSKYLSPTISRSSDNCQLERADAHKRSFKFKRILHRFATERRAARTLGIIMGVFVVCWLPFFIYNTFAAIYPEAIRGQQTFFAIVTWLGYINSSVNPFIYAYSLRDIRRAVDDLCCGKLRNRRRGNSRQRPTMSHFGGDPLTFQGHSPRSRSHRGSWSGAPNIVVEADMEALKVDETN